MDPISLTVLIASGAASHYAAPLGKKMREKLDVPEDSYTATGIDLAVRCLAGTAAAVSIGGLLIPGAFSVIGLSSTGIAKGSYFAGWQASGWLTKGSVMAKYQSLAMSSAEIVSPYVGSVAGVVEKGINVVYTRAPNAEETPEDSDESSPEGAPGSIISKI